MIRSDQLRQVLSKVGLAFQLNEQQLGKCFGFSCLFSFLLVQHLSFAAIFFDYILPKGDELQIAETVKLLLEN